MNRLIYILFILFWFKSTYSQNKVILHGNINYKGKDSIFYFLNYNDNGFATGEYIIRNNDGTLIEKGKLSNSNCNSKIKKIKKQLTKHGATKEENIFYCDDCIFNDTLSKILYDINYGLRIDTLYKYYDNGILSSKEFFELITIDSVNYSVLIGKSEYYFLNGQISNTKETMFNEGFDYLTNFKKYSNNKCVSEEISIRKFKTANTYFTLLKIFDINGNIINVIYKGKDGKYNAFSISDN